MHHGILLKVHGDNLGNAQKQADAIMDKTIRCEHCEQSVADINWDSYRFYGEVNLAWIKKNRPELKKVKTVEDLVKHYIATRKDDLNRLESAAAEELDKLNVGFIQTKHFPRYSMLDFYMKEINNLQNVMEFGDDDDGLYTLHCTDNHYADMTEYTEGAEVFYLWYDRHY